jgi:hypothetical protein
MCQRCYVFQVKLARCSVLRLAPSVPPKVRTNSSPKTFGDGWCSASSWVEVARRNARSRLMVLSHWRRTTAEILCCDLHLQFTQVLACTSPVYADHQSLEPLSSRSWRSHRTDSLSSEPSVHRRSLITCRFAARRG